MQFVLPMSPVKYVTYLSDCTKIQFDLELFNSKTIFPIPNFNFEFQTGWIQFEIKIFDSKKAFSIRSGKIQFEKHLFNSKSKDSIRSRIIRFEKNFSDSITKYSIRTCRIEFENSGFNSKRARSNSKISHSIRKLNLELNLSGS